MLTIGLIGSFGNGLKGVGVAIEALGIVHKYRQEHPEENIPDFHLKIMGQSIAAQWGGVIQRHGLDGKIEFCGTLARGQKVLGWLDDVDLYLQPSFHEGLPRALIEAMSRACPVLASNAGGTEELLDMKFIHDRGKTEQLAEQILSLMGKEKRQIAAQDNFQKAKGYTREELIPRRRAFWEYFAGLVQRS